MVTFIGPFKDPTEDWFVGPNPQGEGYTIFVKDRCDCGSPCCNKSVTGEHQHTSKPVFEEEDDAYEYIESMSERINEQYDEYLEEYSFEDARMERYEMWKNEY
jgi:hypothetical protein